MRTIHKFPVVIDDQFSIEMPVGAEVLSVHRQGGGIFVWAIVDSKAAVERRCFAVRGTGHPLRGNEGRFIGTVLTNGDALVWHIFENPMGAVL
jgi:hypothetical protein